MDKKIKIPFEDRGIYRVQDEQIFIIGDQNTLNVPEDILFNTDDNLPEDIRVWGYLKKNALTSNEMPTQNEIADFLKKSRPTINMSLQMLRINRYITIMTDSEARQSNGQFRRLVYIVNDERLPIQDTLQMDPSYIEFVEDKTNSTAKRLKEQAFRVLSEVRDYLCLNSLPSSEAKNSLEVEGCKIFLHGLHGKHLSSSTTTNNIYTNNTSTTGNLLKKPDQSSENQNQTTPEEIDQDDLSTIQSYLVRLPKTTHNSILQSIQSNALDEQQSLSVLRVAVNRHEKTELEPIDNLPKYINRLCVMAKENSLYDSEAERQKTREIRAQKAKHNADKSLTMRGKVVGVIPNPGESQEAFKKRVENKEYERQMQRYRNDD